MKTLVLFTALICSAALVHAQCQSKSSSSCKPKSKSSCTTQAKKKTSCSTYTYTYTDKSKKEQEKTRQKKYKNPYTRLVFQWGGAANFQPNPTKISANTRNGDQASPNYGQNFNWQTDAMLGLRLNHKGRRSHLAGVYGNLGLLSSPALSRVLQGEGLNYKVNPGSQNTFRSAEAGVLLWGWFRLSGGIGQQNFYEPALGDMTLNYYSATTGVYIPIGRQLVWYTTMNTMFGRDYDKFAWRPATGISFRLSFLKI